MRIQRFVAGAVAAMLTAACGHQLTSGTASRETQAVQAQAVVAPTVTEILSPNFDGRDGAEISAIVLHHTATLSDAEHTAKFFQDPKSKVSSHYIVDRSGSIVRSVPDDKRSWHAGKSQMDGVGDVNDFSIGIEICNVGDSVEPYPEAQMQAVVKLVAWLSVTYKVPLTRLTRHRDVCVPVGRKKDTSDNFDQVYVAKAVQALIAGRRRPRYLAKPAPVGYDPSVQSHVVRAGETWDSISDDVYDTPAMGRAIAALNYPGGDLMPGTVLRLPTTYQAPH